jgi:Domain of unknown function (DUF397)
MTAPAPDRIVWQKNNFSTNNGACVEVSWRTSSYTNGSATCVEVAPAPGRVLVRDSKDPAGPALAVPSNAWQAFLTTLTP